MVSWFSQSALMVNTGWVWLDRGWICVDNIRTDQFSPFDAPKKSKFGFKGVQKWKIYPKNRYLVSQIIPGALNRIIWRFKCSKLVSPDIPYTEPYSIQ